VTEPAVEVIVVLTEQPSADGTNAVTEELARTADSAGVTLRPLHPDAAAPDLAKYLVTEVTEESAGSELAAAFGRCPGVAGAYVKPAAGPPGGHP
jgi:hypothetical protein